MKIKEAKRTDAFRIMPENLKLITDIMHPLYDSRVNDPFKPGFLDNIRECGIIVPVVCQKVGKGDDETIVVVDGRQRVKAALAINEERRKQGLDVIIEVPCIIKTDTEENLFQASISCNEARRNDEVLEKAEKAQRMLNLGFNIQKVAISFLTTPQTIKSWIDLLSLAKEVRDEIKAGTITATAAREFVNLNREGQLELLAKVKGASGNIEENCQKAIENPTKKVSGSTVKALAKGENGKNPCRVHLKEIRYQVEKMEFKERQGHFENDGKCPHSVYLATLKYIMGEGPCPVED